MKRDYFSKKRVILIQPFRDENLALSSRASEARRDLVLILKRLKPEIPPASPFGMTKREWVPRVRSG